MPPEIPHALRSARAAVGTGSAKRRSNQSSVAIGPPAGYLVLQFRKKKMIWRASSSPDCLAITNHGRPLLQSDDHAVVLFALTVDQSPFLALPGSMCPPNFCRMIDSFPY